MRDMGRGVASKWGGGPCGYRNTINDNVVLVLLIEMLEGVLNADEIAKVPGVTAVFAATGDLLFRFPPGNARLRTRHQHRSRRRHQSQREAVRPVCLARSAGF